MSTEPRRLFYRFVIDTTGIEAELGRIADLIPPTASEDFEAAIAALITAALGQVVLEWGIPERLEDGTYLAVFIPRIQGLREFLNQLSPSAFRLPAVQIGRGPSSGEGSARP